MSQRRSMLLAIAAGLVAGLPDDVRKQGKVLVVDDPPKPREYPYYNAQPMPRVETRFTPTPTAPGRRQGERVERQVKRALRNPFEASDKCIERIKARNAAILPPPKDSCHE